MLDILYLIFWTVNYMDREKKKISNGVYYDILVALVVLQFKISQIKAVPSVSVLNIFIICLFNDE